MSLPSGKVLPLETAFRSTFHDKYDFDDFLSATAEKESTPVVLKKRSPHETTVFVGTEKLKRFHRFLNSYLFEFADINTRIADAYIKGKNTLTSVRKHATNSHFFRTDIVDFFGQLSRIDANRVLERQLGAAPISDFSDYREVILGIVLMNDSLPMGFSTSPSISNACLFEFDNAIEQHCNERNIIYSRYSDDLIFSSSSQEKLSHIDSMLKEQLQRHFDGRLRLNSAKTTRTHAGNKVNLLGLVILPNGHVTVDNKIKKNLEVLLHFYRSEQEKYRDFLIREYSGHVSKVSGQLRYVNTIDPNYVRKLRSRYGNLLIDYFLGNPE
ncbi:MAG: reverse transcriptase domain-containing protein [Pseudohongiellaceae bacterium]